MLNEEKIRLMTGIAMYEKKAKKDIFPVTRYFKSDYVGSHMICSFLSYTVACLLFLAIWLLYQMEEIFNTMDITVLISSAKYIGILYLTGLVLYLFITFLVYSGRYDIANKRLRVYQAKLRRLEKKYSSQDGQNEGKEESLS